MGGSGVLCEDLCILTKAPVFRKVPTSGVREGKAHVVGMEGNEVFYNPPQVCVLFSTGPSLPLLRIQTLLR